MSEGTESNYPSLYGRNGQKVPIPEEYVSVVTGETLRPLDGNSEPREPVKDIRDNRDPEKFSRSPEVDEALISIRAKHNGGATLAEAAKALSDAISKDPKRGRKLLEYQRSLAFEQRRTK
jgi:hypothetical protein